MLRSCLLILLSAHVLGVNLLAQTTSELPFDPSLTLWYDQPAEDWTEALPVGNGRLAAMVHGGTESEVIQFNEETIWTGQPHDYAHEGAHEVLDDLRRLLWEGKQAEAHELGNERFMSEPFGQLSYQPFGDMTLRFPGHENATAYRRQLDLSTATTSVRYEVDGVTYSREVLASQPDQAIVIHLSSSQEGSLNLEAGLRSPHEVFDVKAKKHMLVMSGQANNYPEEQQRRGPYPESKITFEARLKVFVQGKGANVLHEGGNLRIQNATEATLVLVGASNFVDYRSLNADPSERCQAYLQALGVPGFAELKRRHVQDYQALFKRVHLDLGKSKRSFRPTHERLRTFAEDQDPSLVALLYQFGRYLLISSSRPGTQPANLQGIWNDKLSPPWDSKYTININTEMNYWPAEITNLSELSEPLIRMVEELAITGENVAREHYAMEGWVTHHNTDIWRGAAPINNANHGIWVTGGAWLSQHLWWHYEFTGDKDFLRDRAYPVLKKAAQFFTEYLVPDPKHPEWLVSGPSNSPETGGLVMAPTMDHQIIRNLFRNTIESANILGVDEGFRTRLQGLHDRIAPNLIGQHGQLQEWLIDQDDPQNEHRHVSHLWGLHPGNEIHPLTTPELAEACKVTLSHRGDGGTGWSRAWKINFWARLLDGDHAFELLKNLMVPANSEPSSGRHRGGLYNNLFDAHPPFQIDGNFGATSGMTEMLLQSHLRDEAGDYFLDLLPALPAALATGSISGLKGRGGFEVSIQWEAGKLLGVEVTSLLGQKLNLRYQGTLLARETAPGGTYRFVAGDFSP